MKLYIVTEFGKYIENTVSLSAENTWKRAQSSRILGDKAKVQEIELPSEVVRDIYYNQLFEFQKEDAINHLINAFNLNDEKEFPLDTINDMKIDDLLTLIVKKYCDTFDCNFAENDTYYKAINSVLDGRTIPTECYLRLDSGHVISMHFTNEELEKDCVEAVYYDIFDRNGNIVDGGQMEYDKEIMETYENILFTIDDLFDFIGYRGDYEVLSLVTEKNR